jgi:hypothetical protein
LDPQRRSYGFGYRSPWSLVGLVHALAGVAFLVVRLQKGYLRQGGMVVVIMINLEWGSS